MASIPMAMSVASTSVKNRVQPSSEGFFKALPVKLPKQVKAVAPAAKLRIQASLKLKEKAVSVATAAAMAAAMVLPDVAQAADTLTPSLKNFLLSIAAGTTVLAVLGGAVIAVSNFDPVKRT